MSGLLLIYDERCGFCRWSLARVLAWDRRGRVRPLPMQDTEAAPHLGGMPEGVARASWHVVEAGGRVRSAGAAFPPLLRALPGGRPLAALAAAAPATTDRAYRWVAERRGRWGRFVTAGAARRARASIERRRGISTAGWAR